MEFEPQDQDIIGLLTKLKNAEGTYPEHMFVARRHMYLKRMAEIGMGIPADVGIRSTPKNTNPPPPVSPATSTLLESALLVAILVEASAVAYFYRDQLADFFETRTSEPRVQEVSPLPIVATSVEIQGVTPSPAVTATAPSATLAPSVSPSQVIVTVQSTPLPGFAEENNNTITGSGTSATTNSNSGTNTGAGASQGESTPVPGSNNNDHDNQGNHYGQTPKPERTIESNGNQSPGNDNNLPAQDNNSTNNNGQSFNGNDNQPPRDEPRPTKTR